MENATKALMIAGAVLLVILIIGIGMLIYNRSNDVIGQGTKKLDAIKVQQFNSTFSPYEGKQSGSNVKALIGEIITHNARMTQDDTTEYLIELELKGGSGSSGSGSSGSSTSDSKALAGYRQSIVSGATYNVTYETGDSGFIQKFTVERIDNTKQSK